MLLLHGHPQLSGKFKANPRYLKPFSGYKCSPLLAPPDVLRLPMVLESSCTVPAALQLCGLRHWGASVVNTTVIRWDKLWVLAAPFTFSRIPYLDMWTTFTNPSECPDDEPNYRPTTVWEGTPVGLFGLYRTCVQVTGRNMWPPQNSYTGNFHLIAA